MAAVNVIAIASEPVAFVAEVLKHIGGQHTKESDMHVNFAPL
jgi:hypothetical protein